MAPQIELLKHHGQVGAQGPDLGIVLRINAIALEANFALLWLFQRFEHRSRVDFPEPLEPIKAMTSPWLAVKLTPLRTSGSQSFYGCF